jgi:hypothetical protein
VEKLEHTTLVAQKVGGHSLIDEGIEKRELGIVRRLVGQGVLGLLSHGGGAGPVLGSGTL